MRSAIAEVQRFPVVSRDVNEMARKRATANVAELLSQLARTEKIDQSGPGRSYVFVAIRQAPA